MTYDAYESYAQVDLGAQTAQASSVQLVLILMNGLQDELARARAHIEGSRFEAKARCLDKCVGMLNGLSSSLDTEAGGEVVAQVAQVYDYCARRLHEAGVRLDVGMVDEVSRLLRTLQEGWEGMQAHHG